MRKGVLILIVSIIQIMNNCFANPNFYAYSPSGHRLAYYINIDNDSLVWVAGYFNTEPKPTGAVIIPDTVTYSHNGLTKTYRVSGISYGGFENCVGMTSVLIPNTVNEIQAFAFENCTGLTSITIPESVEFIRSYAFSNCTGLTTLNYNAKNCYGMGTYDEYALAGCDNLTTVNIGVNVEVIPYYFCSDCNNLSGNIVLPNSIKTIGIAAFKNCSGLTGSLIIPDSVRYIGDGAFSGCSGLGDTLVIGKSVLSFGSAFAGCTGFTTLLFNADSCYQIGAAVPTHYSNITNISIAPNVKVIPFNAFAGCTELTGSIIFPPSVESIGRNAFFGCSQIQELVFERGNPPAIHNEAFSYVNRAIPVHVPCGSVTMYQQSLSGFTNIVNSGSGNFFNAVSNDESAGTVHILVTPNCVDGTAILQAVPVNGYRFDHWNTGVTDNPYTLMVTSDTTIIAYFVADGGTESITDAESGYFRVSVKDGHIILNGVENEQIRVFDIMGRHTTNEMLPNGVYLVKVGNNPARKVVVIR